MSSRNGIADGDYIRGKISANDQKRLQKAAARRRLESRAGIKKQQNSQVLQTLTKAGLSSEQIHGLAKYAAGETQKKRAAELVKRANTTKFEDKDGDGTYTPAKNQTRDSLMRAVKRKRGNKMGKKGLDWSALLKLPNL